MENQRWDAVIIGGGPAGLSAALMLGRARRRVMIVDSGSPRNRFAAHIHGTLGAEGSSPSTFLEQARDQVSPYDVTITTGEVCRVDTVPDGLEVVIKNVSAQGDIPHSELDAAHDNGGTRHDESSGDGGPDDSNYLPDDAADRGADVRRIRTRSVIAAGGLIDSLSDIPGLADRWGTSVLHCPYCHGWEVAGQRIGVIATSPLSVHQAQLVRQWSDEVTLFTAGAGQLDMMTELRLLSRGIRLVSPLPLEIVESGDSVAAVRTADGQITEFDALFVVPAGQPRDACLAPLALDRTESALGSFIKVDATGKTSHDRVWAIGNVVDPAANIAMSVGAGALAGGAVNAALIAEEFDDAQADPDCWPHIEPRDYWEYRYGGVGRMWSGNANAVLRDVASGLRRGRALDLGCGEGADAIWLARQGWQSTGIDISAAAIARARAAALEAGLIHGEITFEEQDLSDLSGTDTYDLVTVSYLHSPVPLERTQILRSAAQLVSPAGHLLITSHAAPPPGVDLHKFVRMEFLAPDEEVASLALDEREWTVEIAETRSRTVIGQDGDEMSIEDSVVLLRHSHPNH